MSANHTPYDYTPQGIAERWTREKAWPGYDFHGAIEALGVKRAVQGMKEDMREESHV